MDYLPLAGVSEQTREAARRKLMLERDAWVTPDLQELAVDALTGSLAAATAPGLLPETPA